MTQRAEDPQVPIEFVAGATEVVAALSALLLEVAARPSPEAFRRIATMGRGLTAAANEAASECQAARGRLQ